MNTHTLHTHKLLFILLISIFIHGCTTPISTKDNSDNLVSKVLFVTPFKNWKPTTEELNDINSLKYSLTAAGVQFDEVSTNRIDSVNINQYNITIIPNGSAKNLTKQDIVLLQEAVNNGLFLFTDGYSALNVTLGIKSEKESIKVSRIKDKTFTKNILYWNKICRVNPISIYNKNTKVLYSDYSTNKVLAVYQEVKKGKIISFAPLFDPITNKGYSRFPYLIETLETYFGLKRPAERKILEVYFDPGMHPDSINVDRLANKWRMQRIKSVYIAGWYYDNGYDYASLINACHQNGIIAFCWLETPMVSKNFWKKHPKWREKTATLADAKIDWRYLMNLADTNCLKQIFKEYKSFFEKHDWDGVNIGEIYFESSSGMSYPELFTPMNNTVRKDFAKISKFDPKLFFVKNGKHYWKKDTANWHKFLNYRKELCYQLKRKHVAFFDSMKQKNSDFEIMTTVIDAKLTPEISNYIAESTEKSIALQKEFNTSLQIEDPSNCWGSTPDRYQKLGEFYRQYITTDEKLIFDCNVVSSHTKGFGGFPSEKPSGEEIRQIVYNMTLVKARPAFYAEDAIKKLDYKNISTTAARDVKFEKIEPNHWTITTPYSVYINTHKSKISALINQGEWLAIDSGVILIPKGSYELRLFTPDVQTSKFRLLNLSGDLLFASFLPKTINMSYSEEGSACYVTLNQKPDFVYVDDIQIEPKLNSKSKHNFVVKLPKGKHRVKFIKQ
jgi:hypothetical protein